MAGQDRALLAPLQQGVHGDQASVFVDAHLIGGGLHIQRAPVGTIGHAVVVAADADAALAADAPLLAQDGIEAAARQSLQARAFVLEVLQHHALSTGMQSHIGHSVEPVAQLAVHVLQVLERAGHEEVGADVAKRALNLALGLGPIGLACTRCEAVVRTAGQQLGVVDDGLVLLGLAQDGGLHAVIQDLARSAAEVFEGLHVATQHRGQVLVHHELSPQVAAVTEHHGKEPDLALDGLAGKTHLELGEVHLGLLARRRLKAHLEGWHGRWPDLAQVVVQDSLAALVSQCPDLAQQPGAGQLGPGLQALLQVAAEIVKSASTCRPGLVLGRGQPLLDVLAHRLAVVPGALGNCGDRQSLPVQLQNHHQSLQIDHLASCSTTIGSQWSVRWENRQRASARCLFKLQTGENSTGQ